ncbi:uncharacterized protein LOC131298656 [Rhododendron vialii]|uniref:uncharacterized protein LOC131298656 n=1 Tax=Rhododendron vialii TaxID=182163 RepID=UPI00265F35EF|nr:uncharacterized protein LOC131298656 [Rhododendron vialii]
MGYPHLKERGERGKELWRRKGVPESSKQGGNRRETIKEDKGRTINILAEGNGWLNRSAVGKLRRLISIQDLERILKMEKLESVQFKPMGGRYAIMTFSSDDRRNEALQGKWLELWFEEVSPWNGEAAKKERFVWLACNGMPLNDWNVQSFKAIGSTWGCFIEVDNGTLKEVSYAKGRVLIATENSNKIEGEVQLMVNGRKYCVQVVEEGTFRTISSVEHVANPEAEVEDDEVENTSDYRDASSNKEENLVDDMEMQRKMYSDDKVEEAEKFEEDERVEKSENGSYQSVLGKEPNVENSPLQEETVGDRAQGNNGSDGRFNEESSNSVQGLDSIVPDSQSPLNEECFESIKNSCQIQNIEAHGGTEY